MHAMMITDAASETMIRLDMTDPFLRLVKKLSLRKVQRADYAKTIMGGRFILALNLRFRSEGAADGSGTLRGPSAASADGCRIRIRTSPKRRRSLCG
jgi:hypothetical protein